MFQVYQYCYLHERGNSFDRTFAVALYIVRRTQYQLLLVNNIRALLFKSKSDCAKEYHIWINKDSDNDTRTRFRTAGLIALLSY